MPLRPTAAVLEQRLDELRTRMTEEGMIPLTLKCNRYKIFSTGSPSREDRSEYEGRFATGREGWNVGKPGKDSLVANAEVRKRRYCGEEDLQGWKRPKFTTLRAVTEDGKDVELDPMVVNRSRVLLDMIEHLGEVSAVEGDDPIRVPVTFERLHALQQFLSTGKVRGEKLLTLLVAMDAMDIADNVGDTEVKLTEVVMQASATHLCLLKSASHLRSRVF
ncbi:hypothetical protein HK104_003701 [Borealophlyctis nickersoniae]|nr:hypothetical protein HK104_003701 [Borealophlyctis nickersoniae]